MKQLPLFDVVRIIDGSTGRSVFDEPMVRTAAQEWVSLERAVHGRTKYLFLLIVTV